MKFVNKKYALTAFIISLFLGYTYNFDVPVNENILPEYKSTENQSVNITSGGTEITFVYVGSSNCGYSSSEETIDHITSLKQKVKSKYTNTDMDISFIGVSVDDNPRKGIEHLRRSGPYDEIIAGAGWSNTGAIKFIWDRVPGKPGTPQILLLKRNISEDPYSVNESIKILDRKVGYYEIKSFVENNRISKNSYIN